MIFVFSVSNKIYANQSVENQNSSDELSSFSENTEKEHEEKASMFS